MARPRKYSKNVTGIEIPVHQKLNLSIPEAAAYSGIGVATLRNIMKKADCNFVIKVGKKKQVIRRKQLEEYLETHDELCE